MTPLESPDLEPRRHSIAGIHLSREENEPNPLHFSQSSLQEAPISQHQVNAFRSSYPGYGVPLMFGSSLQDLLRDANAGTLHCTDPTPSTISGTGDFSLGGLCQDSFHINAEVPLCDDGYFGGEEFGSGNGGDDSLCSDNDGSPSIQCLIKQYLPTTRQGLTYQEYGKSDNIAGGYGPLPEDGFGEISDDEEPVNVVDNHKDSDSEEVGDEQDGNQSVDVESNKNRDKSFPGQNLFGDCGCVSGHHCDDDSGDEDDSDDDEVALADCDLQQEIYVDKSQIGVPYKKRRRISGHVKRPNCRKARTIGAAERSLRSSSLRKSEHIFEPVVGMVFDSRQEAK